MTTPYVKLEAPLNELTFVCRGCLVKSGEMKNMFDWGLFEDFFKFTEVSVKAAEGLSHLLCTACEETLILCKQFRTQCQKSDLLLRNSVKKKPIIMLEAKNSITSQLFDKRLVLKITAPNSNEKIYFSCPHCQDMFMKKKDLMHHMVKYHQVDKDFAIELQYYCSSDTCSYHINSFDQKYFTERKFLNQHFNKVHRLKIYHCGVCNCSFSTCSDYNRHFRSCNMTFSCDACDAKYNTNEKLTVHLLRKHPDLHRQYKMDKKASKRSAKTVTETKKLKIETDRFSEYICDSPKRSFATQTLSPEENIKNDVTLPSWQNLGKDYETKTDETSTQTVFDDLLSLKSQTSEDESIFFSETVSLSDIQTQTFPVEFGLSRSNKETITSGTQSPDLSIKETQTCLCLYESPKPNFRLFDSMCSSPSSIHFTSAETQTGGTTDVPLSTMETQTYFSDELKEDSI